MCKTVKGLISTIFEGLLDFIKNKTNINGKMDKRDEWAFHGKKTEMHNKHKKMPASLKKMPVKITRKYHFTSISLAMLD